jgi:hypothetical protein
MQVAGPVACASRGWVIVDVDLIGCEICGSRLSLPVPPSWSRHQGIIFSFLNLFCSNDLNFCSIHSTLWITLETEC